MLFRSAEDYLGSALHGIRTFKVEARRADKTYPMTSPELMRELGAYLLGKHNYLKVDVHNPQFKVMVEIRDYGAYIHGPKIQGEGGLPVGTSGRALNMLSGGIDSPVAAYRMAKRGLALDHIHFASPPYTSERAKLKVKALAQLITVYTGSANLFVVPYTKPQEYIRDNAPDVLFTVLMRRSMMRIANVIAKKQGCEALVTGESLAQVASQTVKALQCTDAAQDLPILRPLIGMDKTEIIETSRHINTFETSILPYEDCCTIFTPPHPKIRPELDEILEAEAGMPGLAQLTSIYTGSSNLFVVPYTKPQEYIRDNAPDVLFTVLMRRSMMRIANVIAKRQGCEALVTGESLAQVASQTVKALQCTDAAQDLPILRPLIGMDKTEIVETARHINTFETSIQIGRAHV